jgi:hypothetical protein
MEVRLLGFGAIEVHGLKYEHDIAIDGGEVRKRKKKPSKPYRPHYRSFPTTTSRSASRRRDGTQRLRFPPLTRSLSPTSTRHRRPRRAVSAPAFPRSVQEPQTRLAPPTCRTPPGQYSGARQAHPGSSVLPRFRCQLRLFDTVNSGSLTLNSLVPTRRITSAFSSSLTTTVINQPSTRRFDATPRKATPKGHNLHHPHSTASRRTTYPRRPPLRTRGTQQTLHSGQLAGGVGVSNEGSAAV